MQTEEKIIISSENNINIEYTLTRKKVKNINLRINSNGKISVSAPCRVPKKEIERFLLSKKDWIIKNQQKSLNKTEDLPCAYTKEECFIVFSAISDTIFPLFQDILDGEKPVIKVKEMKSRWGVCKPLAKEITLNSLLMQKPRAALEYVIMHEYVHFIHPNHQEGFHNCMRHFMPDYKERKKLLK